MGFILHNIYGGVKRSFTVRLQTMKLVTCDNIITLNAEIIGFPGTSKFRWEQVTGIPVAFLEDQNQQMVTYQQTQVRDDKIFRFFVNKGTSVEQQFDIRVTAIPRETVLLDRDRITTTEIPFGDDERPFMSIASTPLAPEGKAVLFALGSANAPKVRVNAKRDVNNIVYTIWPYGVQQKQTFDTGPIKAGQYVEIDIKGPWQKQYTNYIEQEVALPSDPGSAWLMKFVTTEFFEVPPVAACTESFKIYKPDIWAQVMPEQYNFLDLITRPVSDQATWVNADVIPGVTEMGNNFLTLLSLPAMADSVTIGLNTDAYALHYVVATNFIDISSVGG